MQQKKARRQDGRSEATMGSRRRRCRDSRRWTQHGNAGVAEPSSISRSAGVTRHQHRHMSLMQLTRPASSQERDAVGTGKLGEMSCMPMLIPHGLRGGYATL